MFGFGFNEEFMINKETERYKYFINKTSLNVWIITYKLHCSEFFSPNNYFQ